ncbi:hypothetical protein VNI00_005277 [Paramarasmius palmivorus]|uniref:EthD domain-containing protein n=1 Tax=Paramarasmius palmivorus TaxID=297713 RepID=A0AAW0DEN1_9AGAR
MPKGFLIVFSEPGSQVSLDEFQDWYNNEHVPLRLNYLPDFETGARYSALDGQKPGWVSLYEVTSVSIFSDPSYTRLRENRSPREVDLIKRLDLLDRRTYEAYWDSGEVESSKSCSLKVGPNSTSVVVTHGLELVGGKTVDAWIEEAQFKNVEGWLRTRVVRCVDNLKTGLTVPKSADAQKVPEWHVVHELLAPVDNINLGSEVVEMRTWKLYRAYPSIAQGNVPPADK